ncbi:hypothetical protein [Nostoc sp.]|uniref:hypothetical protein n=1 Tax=Nostoc sp. TaxID=1180 RepID=UPI002FF8F54D
MSSGFANTVREPLPLSTFYEKSGAIYTAEFRILGHEAQTLDLPPLIPPMHWEKYPVLLQGIEGVISCPAN